MTALRPIDRSEFFGQPALLERLGVLVDAAAVSGRPLPHMLFPGPVGAGKTALAHVLADLMGAPIYTITDARHLVGVAGAVLFIPDLHDAPRPLRTKLLALLRQEDPAFTIIATAAESHRIDALLFHRFMVPTWDDYSPADMVSITTSMAAKAGTILSDDTLAGMARAAAGSPGSAAHLVGAAQALAMAHGGAQPDLDAILAQAGFGADGLTAAHMAYLDALHALGGAASLPTVALVLRRHPEVIRDLDPLLLADGLVERAGAGRQMTRLGFDRLRASREAVAA